MSVLATPANMRKYEQPSRKIDTPDGPVTIIPRQPVAYSPETGETYSASAGDYWKLPDDEPLRDYYGDPMILVFETHGYVDVDDES